MREIVFDTETTGFDPATGDRIVEIGAVEIENLLPTGRTFHRYINPERPMPAEAFAVHGLGDEFLRGQPVFAAIAGEFLDFVGDAPLIAHNARFDYGFLNAEFERIGLPTLAWERIVDTLAIAKAVLPGASASLDALCQRFGVDNSGRDLHGALLDARLLAEVYLELRGGRQTAITFTEVQVVQTAAAVSIAVGPARQRPTPRRPLLTDAERAAHAALVARLGDGALWLRYGPT